MGYNWSTFLPGLCKNTLAHTVSYNINVLIEILASLLLTASIEPEVLVQKWIYQARQKMAILLMSTQHMIEVEEETK